MVQLLRFIAVAILVGCSFCVAQFGPYDIKWHAEKKIDVPEFDCSSAGVICDPGLDHYIDPSIYENSKCILLIGYDYSFLSLGASFGTIAANVLMKKLDSTDRLVFPVWYCGFVYPHDSLYARKLLGRIEMDSIPAIDELPVIDEKYFVYNAPENEFRDETPERPKTIPAGFHNPTILIGSEDRTNVNEAMSKVEKGLCYGSIAAMILSGGNIPVLCEQHGLH